MRWLGPKCFFRSSRLPSLPLSLFPSLSLLLRFVCMCVCMMYVSPPRRLAGYSSRGIPTTHGRACVRTDGLAKRANGPPLGVCNCTSPLERYNAYIHHAGCVAGDMCSWRANNELCVRCGAKKQCIDMYIHTYLHVPSTRERVPAPRWGGEKKRRKRLRDPRGAIWTVVAVVVVGGRRKALRWGVSNYVTTTCVGSCTQSMYST